MFSRGLAARRSPGIRIALALGLALVIVALLPSAASAKTTVHINGDSIANYKFTPPTVTIKRKKTVHWEWDSNAAHNVKFPKLDKKSTTGASETYKLKFKRRGTFKYFCTIHGFRAKAIVKR
jgi:plastocyanin